MSADPMEFHIGYVLGSTFEVLDRQNFWREHRRARLWRLLARALSPRA